MLCALSTGIFSADSAYASERLTPGETEAVVNTLRACDQSERACSKFSATQAEALLKQKEIMNVQKDRIVALEKASKSIFKDPIVMFTLGAAAGGLAVILLRR